MTITRVDVEAMLKIASVIHEHNYGVIAEACKAWLAVDDAQLGESIAFAYGYAGKDDGLCYGIAQIRTTYLPAGTYKLVCIETPKD